MILTIAEDLTSDVVLDTELTDVPDSGMYLNSGVHPSITVNNLLSFLPKLGFTFAAYVAGTTYTKFTTSRNKPDIVESGGLIYQSLVAGNIGNDPMSSPNQWLETTIEALRIKVFALRSQDAAIKRINLTQRLVDSQYLYNVADPDEGATVTLLPNDYAAWIFEPRGSDYVKIKINEVAFQATTATPQSLYVINQGQLVTTLTLNPNVDGRLVFEDIDYEFKGPGRWIFAVDAQNVLTNGATIDPLKYDGFVVQTAVGIGASPEDANYSRGVSSNGLNFNVTAFTDTSTYINKNLVYYANYLQAAWAFDVLNMFLYNSNTRSNIEEQNIGISQQLLIAETKELNAGSVLRTLEKEKKKAISQLQKTFDREIDDNEFEIEVGSI